MNARTRTIRLLALTLLFAALALAACAWFIHRPMQERRSALEARVDEVRDEVSTAEERTGQRNAALIDLRMQCDRADTAISRLPYRISGTSVVDSLREAATSAGMLQVEVDGPEESEGDRYHTLTFTLRAVSTVAMVSQWTESLQREHRRARIDALSLSPHPVLAAGRRYDQYTPLATQARVVFRLANRQERQPDELCLAATGE